MSELGKDITRIRKVCVRSYYLFELAELYNVSKFIMRKRMKQHREIGKPDGYLYDEKQVSLIFHLITLPSNIRLIKV